MKSTGTINITGVLSVWFVIALTMASCDSRKDGGEDVALANVEEPANESNKELSRAEMFEAEFRRVMYTNYSAVSIKNSIEACRATCNILDEVAKLSADESLPLLDKFMDMTLEASLDPVTNYPSQYKYSRPIHVTRRAWFEKMFFIARETFYASMKLRRDPYEDWDKLFAFFGKFTNEVAMVRSCPPIYNEEKIDYLLDIKGAFSTYVHVVRDLDLKHHKTMPTESQKAEIFRRFDELEKYVEKLVPPAKAVVRRTKDAEPSKHTTFATSA